ncbi:hypothetical protein AB0B45_13095 [Nonomuraea sp. NPDC049152]|uniref:hypothetical protein n=1 Tax=Nonomuraea sp. NPDC049152 TaxID=3154350 RepID=UPI0033E6B570
MNDDHLEDPHRRRLREHLEVLMLRAEKSASWREETRRLRSLVNLDGYVPVRTRLSSEDLDFLADARDDLLMFAQLGLRLLDLHQPRDAGGITSDAAHPILRCRSCMWRWPCPTYRAFSDSVEESSDLSASA